MKSYEYACSDQSFMIWFIVYTYELCHKLLPFDKNDSTSYVPVFLTHLTVSYLDYAWHTSLILDTAPWQKST